MFSRHRGAFVTVVPYTIIAQPPPLGRISLMLRCRRFRRASRGDIRRCRNRFAAADPVGSVSFEREAREFFDFEDISMNKRVALIVGAGPGISSAFGEALVGDGYRVALAARNLGKLRPLAEAMDAMPFEADAASAQSLEQLFRDVDRALGQPDVVLYNPSARIRGDLLSLDIAAASVAIQTTAIGALVTAQEAARRMLPRASGSIFFTGATAGIKGFARSSVFAMGKFALRGLAQSLARELGPAGIHVVHFVIDGAVVQGSAAPGAFTPHAIACSYMAALAQPSGAWSWEMELRSHTEPF
jgi:NAD(P)-dependent dehydrogenase (short-subunit alcohol dehydrogenase family)